MNNKQLSAYRNKLNRFGVWLLSSIYLLGFSTTAAAKTKTKMNQQLRSMRSQVKILRLQAEISGDEFKPTIQMITSAPDVVKAEMKQYDNRSKELKELQSRVKAAHYQKKLFESLQKKNAASLGEVRKKIHTYNALKTRLLEMQTQALSDLENELVKEAKQTQHDDWPLKIQLARIAAEINDKPFEPTKEMIEKAPEFVKTESQIYNLHKEALKVIDERIEIASDEIKLSKEAFKNGFISKTEYLKSEHDHNRLVNANLKLHCQILNKSEQIKIETSNPEKAAWGKKVKLARIKAHIDRTPFKPTTEMKKMVPNLVALETNLFNCNEERFKLLDDRENMLKETFKITQTAFEKGVTPKIDMLKAKRQLDNFQDYRAKLKSYFERESKMVLANLQMDLGA